MAAPNIELGRMADTPLEPNIELGRMAAPRAAILYAGSRGDCEPYLVAGLFLRRAGWEVLLAGGADCAPWAEELGLDFFALLPSQFEVATDPGMVKACTRNDLAGMAACGNAAIKKSLPAAMKRLVARLREFKPDILLSGAPILRLDVEALANALRVASLSMHSFPVACTNYRAALGVAPYFPPWTGMNLRLWRLIYRKAIYEPMTKDHVPIIEDATAMKKEDFWPTWESFDESAGKDTQFPALFLCSQVLFPPTPDSSDNHKFFGNFAMPDDFQRGRFFGGAKLADMENFLQAGEPPVYVGFGSLVCESGKFMTLLSLRALRLAGERGVVAAGWAGMDPSHIQGEPDEAELRRYAEERVLFMETSPHGALFPRCKVVVTHGGVGTFHASAKSGRPSVIVPIVADQFNHSRDVNELGIGVGLARMRTTTPQQLAAAIARCAASEEIRSRAGELGARIRAESATAEARFVDELNRYYREEVRTGRHRAKADAQLERFPWRRARSCGCLSVLCPWLS